LEPSRQAALCDHVIRAARLKPHVGRTNAAAASFEDPAFHAAAERVYFSQLFGKVGLLLVPVGALWMASGYWSRLAGNNTSSRSQR